MAQITLTYTFAPNTVISSSQMNTNLATNIVATYNAHDVATTSVHGVSGSIVGTDNLQTLTQKTLVTPTIASFVNATHNHLNAAGGGTLSASAFGSGTLAAIYGGTDHSSYVVGDLLYASTTTALSRLADVATGNVLISGGVGVAPSYGKVTSSHVSGTTGSGNFVLSTSPVLTTPQIQNSGATFQYIFAGSATVADRTVTLPLLAANDTFVFANFTQTLANKTLTSPTISGTVSGTITFADQITFSDYVHVSSTATTAATFLIEANSATSGNVFGVYSNSGSTGTKSLVYVTNDNTAAVNTTCVYITQDAAEIAQVIEMNGNATGFAVNHSGTGGVGVVVTRTVNSAGNIGIYSAQGANSGAGQLVALSCSTLSSADYILHIPATAGPVSFATAASTGSFLILDSAGVPRQVPYV